MIVAMLQENSLMARLKTADTSDVDSSGVEVIDPAVGWVYVGSHNFTQAAWGTLSGTAFNPVLNVCIASAVRSSIAGVYEMFFTDYKLRTRGCFFAERRKRGRSYCMFPASSREVHGRR